MFELTLSTSSTKSSDITFLIKRLRPTIKSHHGIMVCEEFDKRVKLALAVNEDKKEVVLGAVFDAVAEVIIRSYKEQYLKEHLKLGLTSSVTRATFIKALTMFDKSGDKALIKSKLEPCHEILIDSLYNFRLWELEKRWQEICNLVSENSNYLIMSGSFMELMRFLILTSETEIGEVHVHYSPGSVWVAGPDGKEIFRLSYKEKDDNSKIGVLTELISLAPEKIIVHSDVIDNELSSYISSLFDGKVSVLKQNS